MLGLSQGCCFQFFHLRRSRRLEKEGGKLNLRGGAKVVYACTGARGDCGGGGSGLFCRIAVAGEHMLNLIAEAELLYPLVFPVLSCIVEYGVRFSSRPDSTRSSGITIALYK